MAGPEPEPGQRSPREPGRLARLRAAALADDTLSKKASLNALASMLDYTARVIVGLLLNPLLVSRLGDYVFGVYQVLGRLVGYATPAGGRPSQALKWKIAHIQHSTEYDDKRRQVGSALVVWLLFLPLLVLAGGVLAWFAPDLLDAPESLTWTIRAAAGVLVLDLVLVNLLTIPQSVVQGENLGYKRMGLSALVVFAGGGLTALLVVLGAGLVGVTAAVVATTVITGGLFLWVARAHVAWFGTERPPLRAVWAFVSLSGWFLLWNLVIQLMRGSDVVVLGIVGSAELVTTYALSRYVPEAIFGVVAMVVSAIMPGLGGLVGSRDFERARRVRGESMLLTWLIATSAGAAFLLWAESFLTLWVGERYYPGAVPVLLIVLLTMQFAFIRNDASIIDVTLELRAKVVLGLVSSILSIVLAVVLLRSWETSITALVAGFVAGRLLLTLSYPWLVGRYFEMRGMGQLRGAVRPAVGSAVLFAACVAAAPAVRVDAWLELILLGTVSFALLLAAALALGLSGDQRRRLARRARQVLDREREA